MPAPTDLSVILRLYANKQNTPTILISEFCDYVQKYARHYLQETPDLVMYLSDTAGVVQKGLEKLHEEEKAVITVDAKERKFIFVPHFFIDRTVQRYRELDEHPEVPYPLASDIPQGFPANFIKPVYITTDFSDLIEKGERTNAYLFQLIFPDDTPPMVYPAALSPEKLLDLALSKLRLFLRKDESKDYIQKRLMIANPGKELSIKNHLIQFQTRPSESLSALKHSGDSYLFWSYLCSFIRQDFTKKAEKTPEETALLQSVFITEYLNNYYKNRAQQSLQRETALKNLDLAFQKPPYYFDMETIMKFADSRGVPLLGQYKNTDLEAFIKEKTGDESLTTLPPLLVFRPANGARYFVLKENVVPLAIKLCNDARTAIKDSLVREWFHALKNFEQEEAMRNQAAFERKIQGLCKDAAPVLFGLLNATFIPLVAMESGSKGQDGDSPNGFRMFDRGRLLPLSQLLMLDRGHLMTDAKILLPFWYTLPIISGIFAFFHRPRKTSAEAPAKRQMTAEKETDSGETTKTTHADPAHQRASELKAAAAVIEKRLVPSGSTLEESLDEELERWNRNLDRGIKNNLTEDVNSLIRDYVRKTIRSIRAASFDLARVENLAVTLIETPNLMKIKNRTALKAYVQLYILKLVKSAA